MVRAKVKLGSMSFGSRVRLLRQGRGLSQSDLARKMKVSPAAIAQIESCRNPNPTLATVGRIAGALGMSVVDLLSDNQVQADMKERIVIATKYLKELNEEYTKMFGTGV